MLRQATRASLSRHIWPLAGLGRLAVIAVGLLLCLVLALFWNRLQEAREAKRLADERRRASMRAVTERWHFREWERDLGSSDSDFRSSDSMEP